MSSAATPKGERRRQALVEAAADLLLEGGFDAVRHRSVATRADLPLASTTYYFESLDDLIACAVERNGTRDLDAMRSRVGEIVHHPRTSSETADLLVELLVGPCNPDEADRERLITRYERFVACARSAALRDVQRRLGTQVTDALTDALVRSDRDAREGTLRKLVAIVDGAVVSSLAEHDLDPRELARRILSDVLDIVAPLVDHPAAEGA
ncbi:MAG: TetR family transcriptional regulator [Rhodococcus sp.]|nr:TetR family transcriptional regulator [Rhodococcus sp. (in: high G+C Gram-positive bacteria)]